MLNQKGLSSLIVIVMLALLGIGFYAGITSQKIISNITELLQSPEPSVNFTAEPTPTSIPQITPKSSTPVSAQVSSNTSDYNAQTFIKVNAPNGGESFKVGDTMHITWSSNNLNKNGSCIVTLAYDNGSKSSVWIPVNTPNGYFDWKLTSESEGHKVKVDLDCYDSNSNNAHDQSDSYFTVTN